MRLKVARDARRPSEPVRQNGELGAQAQKQLLKKSKALEACTAGLEEADIALKVMLKTGEKDRQEIDTTSISAASST
jgi:hypothetical protein